MSYDDTQNTTEQPSQQESNSAPDFGQGEEFDPALVGSAPKSNGKSMAILGGLALIAGFVVWFMFFRGSPDSAQASASPADGGQQIKQFLDSGNINMMKQTLKETEKIVKQFRSYPGKTQVPVSSLRSNPFRELAPDSKVAASPQDAQKDEELHRQAQEAVSELHIQSIIRGTKYRGCMINNTLYQEGQQIGILKIEQVTANAVIVTSGRYRFEVKMK